MGKYNTEHTQLPKHSGYKRSEEYRDKVGREKWNNSPNLLVPNAPFFLSPENIQDVE